MNKHVKQAVERFKQLSDKTFYINPIAGTDVEVIENLINVIGKCMRSPINSMFNDYKLIPDNEFLIKCTEYCENTIKEYNDANHDNPESSWLKMRDLGNTRIQLRFVLDYCETQVVEHETYAEYLGIAINVTDDDSGKSIIYGNKTLVYSNITDRNIDLQRLDRLLND